MCIKRHRCRGISLVEQIVFIIIIGVGVAGLISTMGPMVKSSGEPMVRKQALVIAESLLNEILQQPFTLCDPDDPKADSATQVSDCVNDQNKGGAPLTSPTPALETRNGGVGTQYDNVADYGNYEQANATDASGNNTMTGYATRVAITRVGQSQFGLPAAEDGAVLRIDVTVTPPGGDAITLSGYRFRYAPRY